jgi:hypothetical protein
MKIGIILSKVINISTIPSIEAVVSFINGAWRIRSQECTQQFYIDEQIDSCKKKMCSSCLHYYMNNFRRLYKRACLEENRVKTLMLNYSRIQKSNFEIRRKLKNAKQKSDRTIEIGISEWEAQEEKLGRCRLYGNLKNRKLRLQIQSCLSMVEKIMIETNPNNPTDPEIGKVLYMLKSSLGM